MPKSPFEYVLPLLSNISTRNYIIPDYYSLFPTITLYYLFHLLTNCYHLLLYTFNFHTMLQLYSHTYFPLLSSTTFIYLTIINLLIIQVTSYLFLLLIISFNSMDQDRPCSVVFPAVLL